MTLHTRVVVRGFACVMALGVASVTLAQTPGDTGKPIVAIVANGTANAVPAPNLTLLDGKLGIGTSSPTEKLDVNGQVKASALCLPVGGCKGDWTTVGGGGSTPWTLSGTTVSYAGGNVGVGTTTPGGVLEVSGGHYDTTLRLTSNNTSGTGIRLSNTGSGGKTFNIVSTGSANGGGAGRLGFFDATYGNFVMSLTNGRVGIGTSAPDRKLHITEDAAGLSFPLVVGNAYADAANYGPAVLFSAGTGSGRGKGAIAYVYDSSASWNKGDFHILQNQGSDVSNPSLSDAVVTIKNSGNVGIGTTAPAQKLHVIGNIAATGSISAYYQDVAEWVDTAEPLVAGTVVVTDDAAVNRVRRSTSAYDTSVAGVVSAQPGVLLGQAGEGRAAVAQSGRVKVKVDASYGAIKPGDVLVTSPREGYAMKSKPVMVGDVPMHRPGTILGKALEALPSGEGEILVLITLQ